MLGLVAALAITFGLLALTLRLLRRMQHGGAGDGSLRVIRRVNVGPKQGVALLRVGDRVLVVSVAESGTSVLTELTGSALVEALAQPGQAEPARSILAPALPKYIGEPPAAAPARVPGPRAGFQQILEQSQQRMRGGLAGVLARMQQARAGMAAFRRPSLLSRFGLVILLGLLPAVARAQDPVSPVTVIPDSALSAILDRLDTLPREFPAAALEVLDSVTRAPTVIPGFAPLADTTPLPPALAGAASQAATAPAPVAAPRVADLEVTPPSPPRIDVRIGEGAGGLQLSGAVGLVVLMGVLTLLPALFLLMTSFTRILIVLHFLRSALGTQTAPPNQLLIAIAVLLTGVIMNPVLQETNRTAIQPYFDGQIQQGEAYTRALVPFREFMLANTREQDLSMMVDLGRIESVETEADIPTVAVVSAFVLSELRTAFQMGFVIFLPFVVVDLVVASVLMSMGMFMLPPMMISLPFKLLLFVLADGWTLVVQNLVASFR